MTSMVRFVAVVCCLCAVASAGCGGTATEEVATETVVPVTVAPAKVGSIRAVIHASGLVAPAPGADLVVTAPEPARITEMPKAEGDSVRRGDLLVRFDIPTLNADAASKNAEVSAAEARVKTARANQVRAHELFERGVAARKEEEDADREVADAEAALNQALAGRSASESLVGRTVVRATFNGLVAKRWHNPGDQVEASATDPILRVIDPNRLEVVASVPITDVSRVKVGASASLTGTIDPAAVPLRVVSRPAAVEAGTAAVPVRLAFLTQSNFAAGTPVQVDVNAEEHANVVVVPADAVVREADETAVYVAAGDRAQRRIIVTGLVDAAHVEVRSGLKAGELVILTGQAGLPDGAAISVSDQESAPEKPADEKPAPEKK
jgi:RND family efflux transporter MFP subunit